MLLDSIHHRGQLSVYVRMTGGKVPSIYGPVRRRAVDVMSRRVCPEDRRAT
jgi:uncharacterized damage-inducible protein DinB